MTNEQKDELKNLLELYDLQDIINCLYDVELERQKENNLIDTYSIIATKRVITQATIDVLETK